MIPLRIIAEGMLIREVYSWIATDDEKEQDEINKLNGGSNFDEIDGKPVGKDGKPLANDKDKPKGQKTDTLATDNRSAAAKAEMANMMKELGISSSVFGGKFGGFVEMQNGQLTSVGDRIEAAKKAADDAAAAASSATPAPVGGQGYGDSTGGSTGGSIRRARF